MDCRGNSNWGFKEVCVPVCCTCFDLSVVMLFAVLNLWSFFLIQCALGKKINAEKLNSKEKQPGSIFQ